MYCSMSPLVVRHSCITVSITWIDFSSSSTSLKSQKTGLVDCMENSELDSLMARNILFHHTWFQHWIRHSPPIKIKMGVATSSGGVSYWSIQSPHCWMSCQSYDSSMAMQSPHPIYCLLTIILVWTGSEHPIWQDHPSQNPLPSRPCMSSHRSSCIDLSIQAYWTKIRHNQMPNDH